MIYEKCINAFFKDVQLALRLMSLGNNRVVIIPYLYLYSMLSVLVWIVLDQYLYLILVYEI